jgi:hypothetical protein
MIQKDQAALCEILGDWVYGRDDQTLAEVVGPGWYRPKDHAVADPVQAA